MPHVYGLDEKCQALVARAAKVAQVAAAHAADVDAKGRFPAESMAALGAEGLLGIAGLGPRGFVAVAEELARACASTAMIYVMHVSAAQAIASSKTLARRDEILRKAAAGKHLTTLALSERGSRSQFWAPVSRLVAATGGGFTTSAQKSWVTSAHHADSFVSSAQKPGAASPLDPQAGAPTVYLTHREGGTVRVTGSYEGLGLRGNDSAPVALENAAVAAGDLISPPGEGAKTMLEVILPWFAIGTAGMAHGLCRAAVAATAAHMAETGFEHLGSKLRDLPTLRARLAQMSVRTEQSRALLGYTCGEMEQPSETTPLFVLSARLAALEAAVEVTDLAMKACGGAAFSKHLPVERIFRDARAGWVMAPTADHLADFIGKALTGLPLFQ